MIQEASVILTINYINELILCNVRMLMCIQLCCLSSCTKAKVWDMSKGLTILRIRVQAL